MSGSTLTVALATKNRSALLRKTLASLAKQTLRTFEIIVGDHASEEDLGSVLVDFPQLNLKTVAIPEAITGIGAIKNFVFERAKSTLVVSVDSGVICPSDFLAKHLSYQRTCPGCYAGPCYGWSEEVDNEWWRNITADNCRDAIGFLTDCRLCMREQIGKASFMLIWGCNFSIDVRYINLVGGFDDTFEGWGWDDIDLAVRLHRLGVPLNFHSDIWCIHYPHKRATIAARMKSATKNWIRTYNKNPCCELELWEASEYEEWGRSLARLMEIAKNYLSSKRPALDGVQVKGRVCFYGFPPSNRNVTQIGPFIPTSRGNYLSSFGLRTPYADRFFDIAVVSPFIDELGFRLSENRPCLRDLVLKELNRIGKSLAFV